MIEKNAVNSQWYDDNLARYETLGEIIESMLRREIENEKLIIHDLSLRVKNKDSFLKKCIQKNYSDLGSQMTDFVGLRIIAYTTADVDTACRIVEHLFEIDTSNSRDKAVDLGGDKVGYLSRHYVVSLGAERQAFPEYRDICNLKAEIQIRTILQHAWAEIEHDREYKFSGKLPLNIYRRFHLTAGILELIDAEFQRLSDAIDEYKIHVKDSIESGNLNDISIDTVSLAEFLDEHFSEIVFDKSFDDYQEIFVELEKYGISTMKDLDDLLTLKLRNYITSYYQNNEESANINYTFFLRSIMILTDAKKYFDKVWQKDSWECETKETLAFWSEYGVNAELIHKYISII